MAEEQVATVVTRRDDMYTLEQKEDVIVVAMPAWQIVGVRTLRVYLQSFVGFLTAMGTGFAEAVMGVQLGPFAQQFVIAASMAVAPATISLLQNTIELLTKLDATNPTLRA
jgi:hypothetical protein